MSDWRDDQERDWHRDQNDDSDFYNNRDWNRRDLYSEQSFRREVNDRERDWYQGSSKGYRTVGLEIPVSQFIKQYGLRT